LLRRFSRTSLSASAVGRLQSFGLLLGFAGVVAISLPQLEGAGSASVATGLGYIILAAAGLAVQQPTDEGCRQSG
jgi:drug/metabolite transporter (DMT)-like permease